VVVNRANSGQIATTRDAKLWQARRARGGDMVNQ
jgi:hypothetical protein